LIFLTPWNPSMTLWRLRMDKMFPMATGIFFLISAYLPAPSP
jgi:hypothetical protein